MGDLKVTNENIIEYGIRLLWAIGGIFVTSIAFSVVATWAVRGVYDDFRHAQSERELIVKMYNLEIQNIKDEERSNYEKLDARITKTTGRNARAIENLK